MSQQALAQVLRQLPTYRNRNVLVNSSTFDDAGVYRLDRHRALVQTTDFFTPIVDDPFAYGQIAAANSLSDVFAMGGRPITALNLMGFPENLVSPKIIAKILSGGLQKALEAGCAIIGGHSIRNPEPIYGLAVTGVVDLRNILSNANARVGDLLEIPAAARWVCFKSLLGRVMPESAPVGDGYFDSLFDSLAGGHYTIDGRGRAVAIDGPERQPLDWVVAGGEIGAGARPTRPDWLRVLRDHCVAAGIPFFFRQWRVGSGAGGEARSNSSSRRQTRCGPPSRRP